jgi:transcriptional pleiotropic regulator of transition state genes
VKKVKKIIRKVDNIGRIKLPKQIQNILSINKGDPLEYFTEKDYIIIRKYQVNNNIST